MTIYCAMILNSAEQEYFLQHMNDHQVFFREEISDHNFESFMNAEICFGNVSRDWVEQSKKLKWLQLESVGYEAYLDLNNREVIISNLKGFFSIPVAETAIAGILSLLRGINRLVLLNHEKKWLGSGLRPQLRTLQGSHVLILGSGGIGQQLAKLLTAFDCRITFFRRTSTPREDLSLVIGDYDLVIGCLPQSPETTHLLNRETLSRMKTSALIANVGRGSLIDEEVLAEKLLNGSLAGAVLDVTKTEPLADDSVLWRCPNIILSQHTGGGYGEEIVGKMNVFLQNLERYQLGQPVSNII